MPSGPKKRKAAKRKNLNVAVDVHQDDSLTNPNPSSDFLSPMPPPQENGKGKRPALIEDEGEETFETPRFHPETPRLPETPYYSMENVKGGRRCEIEGLSEVNASFGEKFNGLDVGIPLKSQESSKEMKLEESDSSSLHQETSSEEDEEGQKDDEGLKDVKLGESVHVTEEESSEGEEMMLENSEKSARVDEQRTPKASIEAVDVSSSNEKEAKVVPWTDEVMLADNGYVNADYNDDHRPCMEGFLASGKRIAKELERGIDDNVDVNVDADRVHFDEQGSTDFRGIIGRELPLDKGEHSNPAPENFNNVVESVQEVLPHNDVDLTTNKIERSVEKSSIPVENSSLNSEEVSQASKSYNECLESSFVACGNALDTKMENAAVYAKMENAAEPSSEIKKSMVARTNEGSSGPEARRATVWNCCGLLEVFTSSNR